MQAGRLGLWPFGIPTAIRREPCAGIAVLAQVYRVRRLAMLDRTDADGERRRAKSGLVLTISLLRLAVAVLRPRRRAVLRPRRRAVMRLLSARLAALSLRAVLVPRRIPRLRLLPFERRRLSRRPATRRTSVTLLDIRTRLLLTLLRERLRLTRRSCLSGLGGPRNGRLRRGRRLSGSECEAALSTVHGHRRLITVLRRSRLGRVIGRFVTGILRLDRHMSVARSLRRTGRRRCLKTRLQARRKY